MIWSTMRRVEYRHCDPAGIVYYPRYFEMLHSVVEEFFRDHLGYAYGDMHRKAGRDVTQTRIKVDFIAAGSFEDELEFALEISGMTASDMALEIICAKSGQPRFKASATLVHTDMTTRAPCPWPSEISARLIDGENHV